MSRVHLNRRLTLEWPQKVADGAGGYATVWQPVGLVWAEVVPGRGDMAGDNEVLVSATAYRITVRAAPQGSPARPQAQQRFRDASRVFHILAVTERDRRGQYLTCFAEEAVA
ncbi:MAG: hypothetical protein RIT14_163 [Pseudomonadota bacterium]|jgi:head-tail adaptor